MKTTAVHRFLDSAAGSNARGNPLTVAGRERSRVMEEA